MCDGSKHSAADLQAVLRQLGCLSAARLTAHDQALRRLKRLENLAACGINGKTRRLGASGQSRLPPLRGGSRSIDLRFQPVKTFRHDVELPPPLQSSEPTKQSAAIRDQACADPRPKLLAAAAHIT